MKLSVVVPTLNEEEHVGRVLFDIARQTRKPEEVIVVDGRSADGTARVVERFGGAKLLSRAPSVAGQRNLGGRWATGDVLVFLDADVRLPEGFFEDFLRSFEARKLDVACALYVPPSDSTTAIKTIHLVLNGMFVLLQKVLASGSGQCIAVRRGIFLGSRGFDTSLAWAEDVELIRRLSKKYRFGVIPRRVFVSDQRFRKYGAFHMVALLSLAALIFVLGRFEWVNSIEYKFGNHGR